MPYIANYAQCHNGILYKKGDIVPLSYDVARALISHKAISKVAAKPVAGEPNTAKAKK